MRIASSWSADSSAVEAVTEAYRAVVDRLEGQPSIVFLHCSAAYDCHEVVETVSQLAPDVALHGATSCLGAMTEAGFHSNDGRGLGMLGILDPDGSYGVGAMDLGDEPRAAARAAAEQALAQADRPGEAPDMVWISACPGQEEAVIEGLEELFGREVPVAGGSSGDNAIAGRWHQLARGQVFDSAVVVTVMFPSTEVLFAFHSGYEPTAKKGTVTRSQGRELAEIDGRPAAEVYNEWTAGAIAAAIPAGGPILAETTPYPLGRVVCEVGGIPYYQLSHPNSATGDGAITLYTTIEEGNQVTLMRGTEDMLVSRAVHVAKTTIEAGFDGPLQAAGALVIYCAGCMLHVQHRMDEVVSGLRAAFGETPFLGAFTFGEQGRHVGGENRHANLMISVLVFGKPAA